MADLQFFYCTVCGAVAMNNFRDDCCRVCKAAMKVNMVNIYFDEIDHVDIREAPHVGSDPGE